jgi:hypothetical protein
VPVEVNIWGEGICSLVRLNFGDGQFIEGSNIDFGKSGAQIPWVVSHAYQGWPGPKTLTAEGVTNCAGKESQSLHVFQRPPNQSNNLSPEAFMLAYGQPGPNVCDALNAPPLRRNTRVTITTNPDPAVRINFGCVLPGCIYDADGEPNSVAPAGFPFPGLKKYSLVLRVGTQQPIQGGSNVSFTTTQEGPLEICVNDDHISDNSGAWGIIILVDESEAP